MEVSCYSSPEVFPDTKLENLLLLRNVVRHLIRVVCHHTVPNGFKGTVCAISLRLECGIQDIRTEVSFNNSCYMKRLVMIFVAGTIGLGSMFAQGPMPRHHGPAGEGARLSDTARVEFKVKMLKEKLSLTDKQAADLSVLFLSQEKARTEAIEAHRKAMEKQAEKNKADFEKILTPEQLEILGSMREQRHPAGPGPEAGPRHWNRHPGPGHHTGPGHMAGPEHRGHHQAVDCPCCKCPRK